MCRLINREREIKLYKISRRFLDLQIYYGHVNCDRNGIVLQFLFSLNTIITGFFFIIISFLWIIIHVILVDFLFFIFNF